MCKRNGARYSAKGLDCDHKEARWAVKYRVGGKQILKTIGPNKREAERHLIKIQSELASGGTYQEAKNVLFKELAEKWLRNHEQGANPKPGTISTYEGRLRIHVLPIIGKKVVNQITAYDIENLKQELRTKISARYTNAILITLGTIFKYGWSLGFCKLNPTQFIKKLGVTRSIGSTISKDEAGALSRHLNEPYKTIFFAMLCTGARVGEITGLQWRDVDFKNSLISIERNVIRGPAGKFGMGDKPWAFGTPKSKESTRRVSMPPSLMAALVRHGKLSHGNNPLGLIFCTTNGNPYDRSMLRVKLNAALKAAGLKHIRLHDLRHTNASWLLADRINVGYVSKHLGHSGSQITIDTYYHVMPKEHEREMKLMDSMFPVWDTTHYLPSLPTHSNENK